MSKRKMSRKSKLIWILIVIGFAAMEFPGILFVGDKAYPFLFGIPFLYAYILFWWLYLCVVIFYAYKNNWGRFHNKS
ncbi:hypothetical protein [Sinanaerobacter chloroacetimidivorans]|uniref:DUF3311 domain-containing protein n=1 Tax=Sinanaerobacter chloroacetimidivorans TaxID=2818044 RepID=A0A8J7W172_9FIRM|nr:hypothetical protein [Sinanaerobacter chloroacetimidivorans]MBR0598907.1 hypothetical protein [Sinanaerobacter chloroacetimidivorans]